MPNMTVVRPSDATETVEAWRVALTHTEGPVGLVLTRQKLPVIDRKTFAPASGLAQGAYVLADASGSAPDVILIATGSEVSIALEAHERLTKDGIRSRVVSMPCWELFDAQPQVLPRRRPPAERPRPGEHRGGLAVRLGALRRPGGRDHRRQPFWRVGAGTRRHARVRLHTRARRRDGESGTETDRLLVRMLMPKQRSDTCARSSDD